MQLLWSKLHLHTLQVYQLFKTQLSSKSDNQKTCNKDIFILSYLPMHFAVLVISFQSNGLPLISFVGQACYWQILPLFVIFNLNFLSIQRIVLLDTECFVDSLVCSTLTMSSHCLRASTVPDKTLAVNIWRCLGCD